MAHLISLSIDATKVTKARMKDGKYINITINISDEVDKYGNNVSAWENQTKDERDSKRSVITSETVRCFTPLATFSSPRMVLLLRQKKTPRTKFRSKLLTCFVLNGGVSGPTFYDGMLIFTFLILLYIIYFKRV